MSNQSSIESAKLEAVTTILQSFENVLGDFEKVLSSTLGALRELEHLLSEINSGEVIVLSEEAPDESKTSDDALDWNEAKRHLDSVLDEYESIGVHGIPGLYVALLPLKNRYDNGERTLELYNEIMESE